MARKVKHKAQDGTTQVTVSLPHKLVERIDDHAAGERRSRSNAMTLLLERALDAAKATA